MRLFTAGLLDGTQAYVLAVIEHATRRIRILGVTLHPTAEWTAQQARNLIMDLGEQAHRAKLMIRDRGPNYTAAFDAVLADAGIRAVLCNVRTPRMNAIAEQILRQPPAFRVNGELGLCRFQHGVSWCFVASCLVAGAVVAHLMGAGAWPRSVSGLAGSTAKSALVLGDYAVTTRNFRDRSALRHAAYGWDHALKVTGDGDGPGRARRRDPAAQGR